MPKKHPPAAPGYVNATLRIEKDLHDQIRQAADARHGTFNSEVKWRLERSFRDDEQRKFNHSVEDLEKLVLRMGKLFSDREIETEILKAVLARDFERAHTLAVGIERTRAREAQGGTQ